MPSSSRSVFVLEFVLGLASILSPAVAQYPKLDPRQRELLSAAKSQLDRAGANIERLAQATTRLKVGDPSVRLQDVEVLLERKREAVQSLVDANSRFRQLPLAHPDVKAQAERLRPLRESLSEAEQQLIVVHDALVAAVGAGSEVSAVVDFERLREFASSFGELVPLSADVERATAVAKLLPRLSPRPKTATSTTWEPAANSPCACCQTPTSATPAQPRRRATTASTGRSASIGRTSRSTRPRSGSWRSRWLWIVLKSIT